MSSNTKEEAGSPSSAPKSVMSTKETVNGTATTESQTSRRSVKFQTSEEVMVVPRRKRSVSFVPDPERPDGKAAGGLLTNSPLAGAIEEVAASLVNEAGEQAQDSTPDCPGEVFKGEWFAGPVLRTYEVVKKVGQGGYATVFLCKHRQTGKQWAIKVCNMKAVPNKQRFLTEITALKRVKHESIIALAATILADDHYYLVVEFCAGGELLDLIMEVDEFPERDAAFVMRQVLDAVRYLHSIGIVHRDLKPENILLVDKTDIRKGIKLSDFGIVSLFDPDRVERDPVSGRKNRRRPTIKSSCGTVHYMAPEILKGTVYDHSCDLWSCGVIMFNILGQSFPFYDDNQFELMKKVILGEYSFSGPTWAKVSASAKNLITRMLDMDPHKRPSASEALQHAWIRQLEKDAIQPL